MELIAVHLQPMTSSNITVHSSVVFAPSYVCNKFEAPTVGWYAGMRASPMTIARPSVHPISFGTSYRDTGKSVEQESSLAGL